MRVMQRVSSTVVCVVGGDDSAIDALRHKANIVVYQPDPAAPAMHEQWRRGIRPDVRIPPISSTTPTRSSR